jgi:hypothetical protein
MLRPLIIIGCLLAGPVFAQSSPNWPNGYRPSMAETNAEWASKYDASNGVLTNPTFNGGTLNGTFGGAPTFSGNPTFSGTINGTRQNLIPGTTTFDGSGNVNKALNINTNLTGSTTGDGIAGWNNIVVNADTLSLSTPAAIVSDFSILHNFGGIGFFGPRLGQLILMNQTGAVAGTPGVFANIIVAQQLSVTLSNSFGGTGVTPTTAAGFATALNPFLTFTSGYTNGGGGSGMEIDVQPMAGSSFLDLAGILVQRTDLGAAQGARDDSAIVIGYGVSQASGKGFKTILGVGAVYTHWPLDPLGTIINAASGAGGTLLAAAGIDFSAVTFSTAFLKSAGFLVDGTGDITAPKIDNGSTGLTVAAASSKLGLYGATPIVKATPAGACAGNTGCQAVRDALGNLGLIATGSITN